MSDSASEGVVPPLELGTQVGERTRPKISCLSFIIICLVCILIAAFLGPNGPTLIRIGYGGSATGCKSNLKNIGIGLEMYSSDWRGKYPSSLSTLTPEYLKTLPTCPSAGTMTYGYTTGLTGYNTTNFEDYYLIWCDGNNHTSIGYPRNFPRYDGLQGLYEGRER